MQIRTINEGNVGRVFLFFSVISYSTIFIRALSRAHQSGSVENHLIILLQSAFGVLAAFLPFILAKRAHWLIPTPFYLLYIAFLWCAIFLGEGFGFYYKIPLWDDTLHFLSGMMASALAFSLTDMIMTRGNEKQSNSLPPVLYALFALFFTVFIGVLWEFYEFTVDGILGLNMQKVSALDSEGKLRQLVGREALRDTVTDLFTDTLGGGIVALSGYFSLKKSKAVIRIFKVNIEQH